MTAGAVPPPIYQISTFAQDGVTGPGRYEYAQPEPDPRAPRARGGPGGCHIGPRARRRPRPSRAAGAGDGSWSATRLRWTYRSGAATARGGGAAATYVDLRRARTPCGEGLTERTRLVWAQSPSNRCWYLTDIAASAATIRDHACGGSTAAGRRRQQSRLPPSSGHRARRHRVPSATSTRRAPLILGSRSPRTMPSPSGSTAERDGRCAVVDCF
jgi:hypothetical protein